MLLYGFAMRAVLDERDWFSEFPDEPGLLKEATGPQLLRRESPLQEYPRQESPRRESPLRDAETLFTVVRYGRPAPIVLAETPQAAQPAQSAQPAQTLQVPAFRLNSLIERVKRAFSPTLTALFIIYMAAAVATAWIGIRRSDAARNSEVKIQASTLVPADTLGVGNDLP